MPGPPRYHFANAGISGYNTFQEVMLFESLIKEMELQGTKPGLVLLSFYEGIWDRNRYGPEGSFKILHNVLIHTLLEQALLNQPRRLIERSQFDDLRLIKIEPLLHLHQLLVRHSKLYFVLALSIARQFDKHWNVPPEADLEVVNYEALKWFREVAKANGIQPVVAYLPADYGFTGWGKRESNRIFEQLAEVCQALDLTLLNPYENMQELGVTADNAAEKLTLVYDSHYSVEGNLLYAKALAPLMVDYLTHLTPNTSKLVDGQKETTK